MSDVLNAEQVREFSERDEAWHLNEGGLGVGSQVHVGLPRCPACRIEALARSHERLREERDAAEKRHAEQLRRLCEIAGADGIDPDDWNAVVDKHAMAVDEISVLRFDYDECPAPEDLAAAVRAGGNAADRVATLEAALREIAAYDSRNETTGCRCGHKMAFCHLVNAEMYCGGETALIARHALGECPPVCTVCIREEQAALSRSSGAAAASGDGDEEASGGASAPTGQV